MSAPVAVRDPLDHAGWVLAAEEELRRLGALLDGLPAEDWDRPTDCAGWTVHDVVAHLVGAAESTASVRELVRQQVRGRRLLPGRPSIDGANALQVQERAGRSAAELREDLRSSGARGIRARRRLPAALRAVRVPFGPPLGTRPLGYLMDRIYTRDAWMHRVDLARATGRPLELTPQHDGRVVADVVTEWAGVHGQPYALTLTGPAGGSFGRGAGGAGGAGGAVLELDAVEFCRLVSGRGTGDGLLATQVPF